MANSKQAAKRARQTEKARLHNKTLRSKARTVVKQVRAAILGKEYKAAMAAFHAAVPTLDSMVSKGIFHKNTVARYKSRLNAKVKALFTKGK